VSNLEKDPAELVIDGAPADGVPADGAPADGDRAAAVVVLPSREVPLGGPRAMTVRRTLPARGRSMIGAWCFLDHYGPTDIQHATAMNVPPHPHTGLQTVSWLFQGEIEHRDSVGSLAYIHPGELNLMTAGHGISHSEVSTPATTTLHGVQLWLALPDASRNIAPSFESHVSQKILFGEAEITVFLGAVAGASAEATTFNRILAAQIDLPAGASLRLPVDPRDEHGILVDAGAVTLDGTYIGYAQLGYLEAGVDELLLEAGDEPARLLLIGGEPFGEQIVMWWNFVGRTHEEIVAYRAAWQAEAIGVGAPGEDGPQFPSARGNHAYTGSPLPAPELPTVRLLPRT
jgi:redox-sensitive bicupin YhaK (pirin superfamily)